MVPGFMPVRLESSERERRCLESKAFASMMQSRIFRQRVSLLAIAFSRIFATCSSINCGSRVNTYGHLRNEVGLALFNFSALPPVWQGRGTSVAVLGVLS